MENEKVFLSVTPIEKGRDSLKVVRNGDGSYTLVIYDKYNRIIWGITGTLKHTMKIALGILKIWTKDKYYKREK